MMKIFVFLVAVVLSIGTTHAQKAGKTFMGTITYDITYDAPGIDATMKAQLPSDMMMYVKGNKMAQETKSAMYTQTVIMDGDTKSSIMLIDVPSQNMQNAIKISKEDIEKKMKEEKPVKVEVMNETKKIAGYNCKKAEITEGDNTVTVYFTEELNIGDINWATQYKDIKGMMMEYSMTESMNGLDVTMKFTVKEIKETKVKDNKFGIPSGYKELTKEEAKKMFGGE
ncbi:MAG: DUF4412 domain-containing protein [Bacteroidia bacterium]|nr:DUF4412 domain-containing protein [Bacteroidia bacterium]